jgi:hypothetical protein
MVNQMSRITRVKNGLTRWELKDGPMSCSCKDDCDKRSLGEKMKDALKDLDDFLQRSVKGMGGFGIPALPRLPPLVIP